MEDEQVSTAAPVSSCTAPTACCSNHERGGAQSELSGTAFRQIEKKYKLYQLNPREAQRTTAPETDLTDVVDFKHIDANTAANKAMIHKIVVKNPDVVCYTFAGVPGLLIFSNVLSAEEQTQCCRDSIMHYGDARRHPNILSTHAKEPRATTCYQPPMRWSTLGFSYEWTSKTYDRTRFSSFPSLIRNKMEMLIGLVGRVRQDAWQLPQPESYQPQTAIVNYYPVGSMMMCHQDVSEESLTQPLVSLSLGCSAIFLMGTTSRDDAPHAFLLRSGDVAAFAGPARTAFHATPRILNDCPAFLTLPEEDVTPEERKRYENYAYHHKPRADKRFEAVDKDALTEAERERYWRLCMRHMRVNINARQVYDEDCSFLFTE